MKKSWVCGAAAVACLVASAAFGQAMPAQDVMFVSGSVEGCAQGPVFDHKVAPGPDGRPQATPSMLAPYSAVGTTRVVRTLGDGNRIVRTNTMRYARDAKGRTRTEYSLAAVGPIPLEETRTVVTIEDPVANKRYVLHPEERRAEIMDSGMMLAPPFARGELRNSIVASRSVSGGTIAVASEGGGGGAPSPISRGTFVAMAAPPMAAISANCGGPGMQSRNLPAPVSLGERSIEGVKVIGSRYMPTVHQIKDFLARNHVPYEFFDIEATDGGHGGGAARDAFAFTVYFDPERAPLNHAIFGPNPTFTGEMIAGEITIAAPAILPLIAGTPTP